MWRIEDQSDPGEVFERRDVPSAVRAYFALSRFRDVLPGGLVFARRSVDDGIELGRRKGGRKS